MDPDLIISYLFKEYRPYLERIGAASQKVWAELLLPDRRGKPDYNSFNKLTSGKPTPDFVKLALKSPETLKLIAAKVGVPRLFGAANYDELEAILRPHLFVESQARLVASRALVIPEPFADGANCISSPEDAAIRALVFRLKDNASSVVCWTDAPAVGTMFIAYALGGTYLPQLGIKNTYLLCPFSGYTEKAEPDDDEEVPFERALQELRAHLGLPPAASAEKLLRTLERDNAIVLVIHPELLAEAGASDLKQLVRAAGSGPREIATFLLLGQPEFVVINCRNFTHVMTAIKVAESQAFFERQWKRYCLLRDHAPADEQGTRLNRARDYYASDKTLATGPASVRMLAFLASNYETFSYFDPTGGWAELASMPADLLPIDIRMHIDEVNSLLRSEAKGNVLRAVEWCSTALYWLTQDAAAVLIGLRGVSWQTFRTAVNKVYGKLITTATVDPSASVDGRIKTENYKMDLATRALVQDRWMRRDPYGRAQAHHAIAKRLFLHCNDKNLLSAEFPYEPHWGRSRMFFLAECVRHLMRSCGPLDVAKPEESRLSNEFPAAPHPMPAGQGGCDPYEVVNFCFEKIFWQELNGNRHSGRVLNRKLARQHGAYELTGELLELLSCGRQLGHHHPALHARHHARYYREVAFAQLDLGRLEDSLNSCERLIRLSGSGLDITEENVEYQLDRIVVLSAMDRIDEAQHALSAVEAYVKTMLKTPDKIEIRLKARRGQLQYLRGHVDEARQTYEGIAKDDASAIARDVAHTYIATLGALGGDVYLQRALTICLQNLFHNSSQGQHHAALGFRVALAHLLRKKQMLDAAETTLDQVLNDILKFGCSERTYLSFLLEAGRIVSQYPDRVARAYAAYLRPCLDRAASLGYVRTGHIALVEAERCLHVLLAFLNTPLGASSETIRKLLTDARAVNFVSRRPEVDPRYGFGPAQVEAWLPRLATAAAIEKELEGMAVARMALEALRRPKGLSAQAVP